MMSIAQRLLVGLDEITEVMDELLDASTIDYVANRMLRFARKTGVAVAVLTDCQWGPLDDTQRQLQRRILELWNPWSEQLALIFSGDTSARRSKLEQAAGYVLVWINREYGSAPPRTIPEAKAEFRARTGPLVSALRSLGGAATRPLVIPDTNVLLRSPDIAQYGAALAGISSYTVVLVPGVLGEMDRHKTNHRNPNVRKKAHKITSRIKGWRKQGRLAEGVKVQGDIYVRVVGREPQFDGTLSWLQPDIVDDRIIASILELQRMNPNAEVILLTGDTLMLAKADSAFIPTGDTPEPELEDGEPVRDRCRGA